MVTVTKENAPQIYQEAMSAAQAASYQYYEKYGEGMFNCGFAWVNINPARGAFVSYLKSQSIGSKGYPKGWQIWSIWDRGIVKYQQDMSVKFAGAQAFVEVLQKYGIPASASQRLD